MCLGLVPQRGEPGAARPHRAGGRGEQGPVRPCPHRAPAERRPFAAREHGVGRRLHGDDPRRVVDPGRERPAGRPPGSLPRRVARAVDPPVHVRRRPRPRPVHGQRIDVGGRRPPGPSLRRLRPRRQLRRHRSSARRRRTARRRRWRDGTHRVPEPPGALPPTSSRTPASRSRHATSGSAGRP